MRILLSIASFNPAHGGPYFSVGNLARALARAGHEVCLVTVDYPHRPVVNPPEGLRLEVLKGRLIPGIRQTWVPGCRRELDRIVREFRPEVMHDNGMWLTLNHQVAAATRRHGIPLVLSPRGCLDPWAFAYRRWKKELAMRLFQRRALETVACFHAASELEAENIRKMGFTQPVEVIPNGIELPKAVECGMRSGECGVESGERYALFIGRLHPIKNLPSLLRAWAEVRPGGWRLKLAGAEEVGHRSELEALAGELGIADVVDFLGPVYDEEKWELIRGASLAFLVSHSENFGISAAEALGCGVPVIASRSTPWACLENEGIGWWVEGTVAGIVQALQMCLSLSPSEWSLYSIHARGYAEANFGWAAIGKRMSGVYAKIPQLHFANSGSHRDAGH